MVVLGDVPLVQALARVQMVLLVLIHQFETEEILAPRTSISFAFFCVRLDTIQLLVMPRRDIPNNE